MKHLDESELSALLDRALEDRERMEADRHLAQCAECREAFAVLEAQDREIATLLKHDPGEAYFATFANRVHERIRGEGVAIDDVSELPDNVVPVAARRAIPPAPESLLERLGRWFSGPRLAWAGAAVAMIVGAGVVFLVGDEKPVRTIEDRTIAARARQVAEPAPTTAAPSAPEAARELAPPPSTGARENAASDMRALDTPPMAGLQAQKSEVAEEEHSAATDEAASSSVAKASAPPSAARVMGRSREVRREQGEDVPVQDARAAAPVAPPTAGNRADAQASKIQRIKEQARAIAGGALESKKKPGEVTSFAAPPGSTALGLEQPGAVRVCGTVRDASGRAISGARVAVADLGTSTNTGATGSFCLAVPPGEHTVSVMAVGFREVRRSFRVGAEAGNQDFTLTAVSVLGEAGGEADAPWPPAAREIAAAAERASREAARLNTAEAHDQAAARWQQVTESVKVGAPAISARRHLADARYRAWQLDPSASREASAMSAISSYLAAGPGSAERERAQRRLEELQRR